MAESSDIDSIKTCNECGLAYELYQMRGNIRGKYICKYCFPIDSEEIGARPKEKPLPSHSWVNDKHVNLYTSIDQSCNKMFPIPWKYSNEHRRSQKETPFSFSSLHISLKPLNCPFKFCRKALCVSGIPFHFSIDHKNVTQVNTRLEATNGADLDLSDLKCDEIICIMLIKLLNEKNQPLVITAPSKKNILIGDSNFTSIKPVVLVLTSRSEQTCLHYEGEITDDEASSVHQNYTESKMNIWVCSNIPVAFSYTLCLSTMNSRKRIKYYGPVPTLQDKSSRIFEEGRGLVLTDHHINFLTKQGKCVLDVIIHNTADDDKSDD